MQSLYCIKNLLPKSVFALLFICTYTLTRAQAVEPSAQPTNLQFGALKAYSLNLSFTTSGADGYLILKGSQPISDAPVDGTTYQKGQGLTNCKVMYVGATSIQSVREVLEGTEYFFKIYAYNGSGSQINYLQANPLSGSVSTLVSDAGNYYSGIDPTGTSFISDLNNLINSHTQLQYTAYKSNIIPAIFERDTVGGQLVVNCEYSNETTIYTGPFDFNNQAYNREHVLCKSWMQTAALYGANSLINYAEGADYYNLLLTRSTPNNTRSNNPLGNIVTLTSSYGESKYGRDANNKPVFEPKANRKGDAARAMMYEMICYDGLEGGWGLNELLSQATDQDQNILKLWSQQDPPDKFERTKNEYISSLQRNRNPFIDHPEWAQCIDFDNLSKVQCTVSTGADEVALDANLTIYPNPANDVLNVRVATQQVSDITAAVYDIYGRVVFEQHSRGTEFQLVTGGFESGNYLLHISMDGKFAVRKFMITR